MIKEVLEIRAGAVSAEGVSEQLEKAEKSRRIGLTSVKLSGIDGKCMRKPVDQYSIPHGIDDEEGTHLDGKSLLGPLSPTRLPCHQPSGYGSRGQYENVQDVSEARALHRYR